MSDFFYKTKATSKRTLTIFLPHRGGGAARFAFALRCKHAEQYEWTFCVNGVFANMFNLGGLNLVLV